MYTQWSVATLTGYQELRCSRCQGEHRTLDCTEWMSEELEKLLRKLKKRKRGKRVKPWTGKVIHTPEPQTTEQWYTKLYPLIRYRLKRKLSTSPEWRQQDMLDNALAHSWIAFQKAYKPGKVEPEDAARIAAYWSFRKTIGGAEFVSTREGGYVDAVDPKFKRETVDLGLYPAPLAAQQPVWDTQDMGAVSKLVGELPERLRDVALCLSANDSLKSIVRSSIGDKASGSHGELRYAEIGAYLGMSLATVERRISDLRDYWHEKDDFKRLMESALNEWLESIPQFAS